MAGSLEIEYASQNPKPQSAAHKRYKQYKVSASVDEAVQKGAQLKDLDFDFPRATALSCAGKAASTE